MAKLPLDLSGRSGLVERYQGDLNDTSAQPHLRYLGSEGQMAGGVFNPIKKYGYLSPAVDTFTTIDNSLSNNINSIQYDSSNDILYLSEEGNKIHKLDGLDDTSLTEYISLDSGDTIKDMLIYEVNQQPAVIYINDTGSTNGIAVGYTFTDTTDYLMNLNKDILNVSGISEGEYEVDDDTNHNTLIAQSFDSDDLNSLYVTGAVLKLRRSLGSGSGYTMRVTIQGDQSSGTTSPFNDEGAWSSGTIYDINDTVTESSTRYACIYAHEADGTTQPGTGSQWETYWDIFDGIPDGTPIATGTFDPSTVSVGQDSVEYDDVAVVFDSAVTLSSGTVYWLVLDESTSTISSSDSIAWLGTTNGDGTYTGNWARRKYADDPAENTQSVDLEASSSQYASITDASQSGLDIGANDATFEAWIKLESQPATDTRYAILSKWKATGQNRSYRFRYQDVSGTKSLGLEATGDGTTPLDIVASVNQTLSNDTWYHVAAVVDISTGDVEFFVDGATIGTDSSGSMIAGFNDGTADFAVGVDDPSTPANYFDGKIHDVRVWNDKRTEFEILSDYLFVVDSTASNLVSNWLFDGDYTDRVGSNDLSASGSPVFVSDVHTYPNTGSRWVRAGYPTGGSSTTDIETLDFTITQNRNDDWTTDNATGNIDVTTGQDTFMYLADNALVYWFVGRNVHTIDGGGTGGSLGKVNQNVLTFPSYINVVDVAETRSRMYIGVQTSDKSTSSNDRAFQAKRSGVYVWDRRSQILGSTDFFPTPGAREIKSVFLSGDGTVKVLTVSSTGFTEIRGIQGNQFGVLHTLEEDAYPTSRRGISLMDGMVVWLAENEVFYAYGSVAPGEKEEVYKLGIYGSAINSGALYVGNEDSSQKRVSFIHGLNDTGAGTNVVGKFYPHGEGTLDSNAQQAHQGDVFTLVQNLPTLCKVHNCIIRCVPTATGSTTVATVKYYFNQSSSPGLTKTVTLDETSKGYLYHLIEKDYINTIQIEIEYATGVTLGDDFFYPSLAIIDYEDMETRSPTND